MSTGYFSRTSRNTPQRNLNKSQQVTQASTNPSQISNIVPEQTNKGGYVYKPPSRIARSNVNTVKQTVTQKALKVEQKITEVKNETTKLNSPVKSTPFIRRPQNQTPKLITQVKTVPQYQIKQQPKPTTKPISRLTTNRQQPIQQLNKPQQKSSQQLQLNTKSTPVLDLKKPLPYSYPKKITRRGPETEEQPQQKRTNLNETQQKFQQTPKFNRLHKVEQPQNPPSSSLQYQRKTTNQPQQNLQLTNSLRNSQSSIKPPSQKIQSPKNIPKPVQTSTKSITSHSARYSNKVQTPTKQEQKVQQNEGLKPQIKRSNLIVFSLHKINASKLQSYFQQLCSFSQQIKQTKENEKTHRQFQKILSKLCSRYENGLTKNAFVLMKSIYSKLVKVQMTKTMDPKTTNQLITKINQCFVRVLQNITVSQLTEKKITFNKLKFLLDNHKRKQKKIVQGAKILGNRQTKKLKEYFRLISDWSLIRNSVKNMKINKCSQINKYLTKQLMSLAFRNMQTFKIIQQPLGSKKQLTTKGVSKVSIIKQKQAQTVNQLPQTNKQLKQQVAELQNRLQELKKNQNKLQQGEELKITISQLEEQNQAISNQLQGKKEKNMQLKQKLQYFMVNKQFSSQEQLSSFSQNRIQNEESTLSLLHQIYMKAYKQSQEQCVSEENILSLYNIHRVEENKNARKTVAQWLAVQENLMLKHWINLYEGNYVENNPDGQSSILSQRRSHLKKLQEENEIIQKFIRSYIKERYMWEQVKQYVAAVIHQ